MAKNFVLSAVRMAVAPMARLAIRNSVQYREMTHVLKESLVDAAEKELKTRGDRVTNSAIAVLGGIDRKEVSAIRREQKEGKPEPTKAVYDRIHRLTQILSCWHQESEYLNGDGQPRDIKRSGSPPSLNELVVRFSGDLPTSTIVNELLRTKCIEKTAKGRYRALRRNYLPAPAVTGPQFLASAGTALNDLGRTVLNNLYRDDDSIGHFEKRATEKIPEKLLPEFHALVKTLGDSSLQTIDKWLTSNTGRQASKRKGKNVRVGLGIYSIVGEEDETNP